MWIEEGHKKWGDTLIRSRQERQAAKPTCGHLLTSSTPCTNPDPHDRVSKYALPSEHLLPFLNALNPVSFGKGAGFALGLITCSISPGPSYHALNNPILKRHIGVRACTLATNEPLFTIPFVPGLQASQRCPVSSETLRWPLIAEVSLMHYCCAMTFALYFLCKLSKQSFVFAAFASIDSLQYQGACTSQTYCVNIPWRMPWSGLPRLQRKPRAPCPSNHSGQPKILHKHLSIPPLKALKRDPLNRQYPTFSLLH